MKKYKEAYEYVLFSTLECIGQFGVLFLLIVVTVLVGTYNMDLYLSFGEYERYFFLTGIFGVFAVMLFGSLWLQAVAQNYFGRAE